MDGIANIARQQQSQINTTETHTRVVEQIKPSTTEIGQEMAYERDDYKGVASILVGVSFGLLAFLKMQSGKMNKSINRDENDL